MTLPEILAEKKFIFLAQFTYLLTNLCTFKYQTLIKKIVLKVVIKQRILDKIY